LKAILEALRVVKELSNKIIIYTDSEYSINCIERWFASWVSQNKLDKKKNIDLIRPAHLYYRHLRIEFKHIRSHTGLQDEHSLGNEEADRLANLALN
jgi:ribonuclease HI